MTFGDLLEWIAAAALTFGIYLLAGRAGAAISAAACLTYFAQCYGATTISLPKRRKRDSA